MSIAQNIAAWLDGGCPITSMVIEYKIFFLIESPGTRPDLVDPRLKPRALGQHDGISSIGLETSQTIYPQGDGA
ncbi:hypothetical protein SK128_024194 [Halocaridina rubra]|uniref:Uncharacterized protein n=1 Tax=Halocaridina rubra TaxID=373956 RepID=A0AAN8XG21_HALRR